MHAAALTPWLDAVRDMRTVQLETMQEPATVAWLDAPLMGILRPRYVERNAFNVPISDPYARFSVLDTDVGALRNGDTITIRGTEYTIVDVQPDSGWVHFRLEAY